MKIGLQVPSFTWPGGPAKISGKLAEIAHVVDDSGFYSLWVKDRLGAPIAAEDSLCRLVCGE